MPRVLLKGPFDFDKIEIRHSERGWSPNAHYDASVTVAWKQRQQEAADGGFEIWDGTYYRAENAEHLADSDGVLRLRLGTVSYRYIATYPTLRDQHARHALDPLYHLATAALICTIDGWYLFGRRTRNGSVDLIGGGVQPDEMEIASGSDLARTLLKEIREETGIPGTDVRRMLGLGVLLSSTTNVLLLSEVDLGVARSAVEQVFGGREDDEMAELVFVRKDQLRWFLSTLTDYRQLMPAILGDVGA